jgi:hypothetical protein
MRNIRLVLEEDDFRPAYVFDDVAGVKLEGIDLPAGKNKQIFFRNVRDFSLDPHSAHQIQVPDDD